MDGIPPLNGGCGTVISMSEESQCLYSKKQVTRLRILYLVLIVVWMVLIYLLRLYRMPSPLGYVILAFPILMFILSFIGVAHARKVVERDMMTSDFLVIGVLFVSALFSLKHTMFSSYIIHIIVIGFIMLIFSSVDVAMSPRLMSISRHLRSGVKTMAVSLFAYVIFAGVHVNILRKSMGSGIVLPSIAAELELNA